MEDFLAMSAHPRRGTPCHVVANIHAGREFFVLEGSIVVGCHFLRDVVREVWVDIVIPFTHDHTNMLETWCSEVGFVVFFECDVLCQGAVRQAIDFIITTVAVW